MCQINIDDKTEETELLKEYIIMEKEKLEEAKKTFHEDKDKYEKYKNDLNEQSVKAEDKLRKMQKLAEKETLAINQLEKQEGQINSQMSKCQDDLKGHKKHKKFLDLLAIDAGKKTRRIKSSVADDISAQINLQHAQNNQPVNTRGDATFMTSVAGQKSQKPIAKFSSSKTANPKALNAADNIAADRAALEKAYIEKEVDLNEDYSDSDEEIYFKDEQLVQFLFDIEEKNLQIISNIQEEEVLLEKIKEQSKKKI